VQLQIPDSGTSTFSAIAQYPERTTTYIVTPTGLYSYNFGSETPDISSAGTPKLVLSGWTTGSDDHLTDSPNPQIINVIRNAPLELMMGGVTWPQTCHDQFSRIRVEHPNLAPLILNTELDCTLGLSQLTRRPGSQSLTLTAWKDDQPASTSVVLFLDVKTPWFGQSWVSLGLAVLMVFASAFAVGQKAIAQMDFVFKVTSFSALILLLHVVSLETALITPATSPGDLAASIALIVLSATSIVGINLILNRVRLP